MGTIRIETLLDKIVKMMFRENDFKKFVHLLETYLWLAQENDSLEATKRFNKKKTI